MNKKAYAFFLKKNRPRNPIAQVLKFFTPQVIKDKKKLGNDNKRVKIRHSSPVLFREVDTCKGHEHEHKPACILCDSGAAGSLLKREFAEDLRMKRRDKME